MPGSGLAGVAGRDCRRLWWLIGLVWSHRRAGQPRLCLGCAGSPPDLDAAGVIARMVGGLATCGALVGDVEGRAGVVA